MFKSCIILLLFIPILSYGHENDRISVIEKAILKSEFNFALINIEQLELDTKYSRFLKTAAHSNHHSYSQFYYFTHQVIHYSRFSEMEIHVFLSNSLTHPKNQDSINLDFVKTKWMEIMLLIEADYMLEAESEFLVLDEYINLFDQSDPDVKKQVFIGIFICLCWRLLVITMMMLLGFMMKI